MDRLPFFFTDIVADIIDGNRGPGQDLVPLAINHAPQPIPIHRHAGEGPLSARTIDRITANVRHNLAAADVLGRDKVHATYSSPPCVGFSVTAIAGEVSDA